MRITPVGDSAVTVQLPPTASADQAAAVAAALSARALPGVVDVLPAFASVTVLYDATLLPGSSASIDVLTNWLHEVCDVSVTEAAKPKLLRIEIPVIYGGADGPDLLPLARQSGMSPEKLVRMHRTAEYTVAAVGFLPGFAYLSGLPRTFARRAADDATHAGPGGVCRDWRAVHRRVPGCVARGVALDRTDDATAFRSGGAAEYAAACR